MSSMSEPEVLEDLVPNRGGHRPSMEETEAIVVDWLQGYSWNSMELCRICNGIDPWDFKGCNYTLKEKGFHQPKGSCKFEARGCRIKRQTLLYRLKKMQRQGLVGSMKINWLDSRGKGAVQYVPTDIFRFWYISKALLATRLMQDVQTHIAEPDYL